jgi:hypothetical protein
MNVAILSHDLRNILCVVDRIVDQAFKQGHLDTLCYGMGDGQFDKIVGWMTQSDNVIVDSIIQKRERERESENQVSGFVIFFFYLG